MYRLFVLRNELQPADHSANSTQSGETGRATRPRRNSRNGERRDLRGKNLSMVSAQAFLAIKDLSVKGIRAEAPLSAMDGFLPGNVYEAHLRHAGTTWKMGLRLIRKENMTLGFEFTEMTPPARAVIEHLIRPFTIGSSMTESDGQVPSPWGPATRWFRGDFDSDLVLWPDDRGGVTAWLLRCGTDAARWSSTNGFATGRVETGDSGTTSLDRFLTTSPQVTFDAEVSPTRRELARDVLLALSIPEQEILLGTLEDPTGTGG